MPHSTSEVPGDRPDPGRSTLRAAPARRLRVPSWRNPRLLLGVLTVLSSAALMVLLVTAQDRTVPVYAAEHGLSAGTVLADDDLRVVHVHLDAVAEHYVSAESAVPEEAQLSRPVSEGELLPASALVAVGADGRRPVTVEIEHALSGAVQAGHLVDVWAAQHEDQGGVTLIAAAAEVADIREPPSAFGTGGGLIIELLVAPEELPELLMAQGRGDPLTVLLAELRDR